MFGSLKARAATGFVVVLSLGLSAGLASPASAGGNSANAKLCQKGGWQLLAIDRAHPAFANEQDCVAFGAKGGTLTQYNPNWGPAGMCREGGWQGLAIDRAHPAFASEQDCLAFVAQGGTPVPENPNWGAEGS